MNRLEAQGLTVVLGRRAVLQEVDFAAPVGAVCGVVGPNGAGKTTLLRALARLAPAAAGRLALDGEPYALIARPDFARRVAYLPQGARAEWPVTVLRLVALGRLPHLGPWQRPGPRDAEAVSRALEAADVAALAERPAGELSQGEWARVLIARALAVEPRCLLADEPVAWLDPSHQLEVMALLRGLARSGASVVVVLHDLALAARFCDRLTLMREGRVLAEGAPEAVLDEANLAHAFGVRAIRGQDPEGGFYLLPWTRTQSRNERSAER